MGLVSLPDPVSMYEGAKNAGLERDEVNAFVSAIYSAQISFLWRCGSSKLAQWLGIGKACQDAATAAFLSLEQLQKTNFLTLTVPQDLLDPDNRSKFQTQFISKKGDSK